MKMESRKKQRMRGDISIEGRLLCDYVIVSYHESDLYKIVHYNHGTYQTFMRYGVKLLQEICYVL